MTFVHRVLQGRRHTMLADLLIWAMALWMTAAKVGTPYVLLSGSDAFALAGSYTVARAFFFGELSVQEFGRVFTPVLIVLVALSVLDVVTGHFFTNDLAAVVVGETPRLLRADVHRTIFGIHIIRATSTFPHPILFGTFCAIAAGISLYSEQGLMRRLFMVAVCLLGCLLSVSSAALLGIVFAISVYCYDRALSRYSARWKALWLFAVLGICALNLLSNRPVGWLVSHLTLDPWTGYWRMLIWDHAFDFISISPFFGMDPSVWSADEVLSDSVDSVWLALALLYGLPATVLLLLANLAACGRSATKAKVECDLDVRRMRTQFSLVIALFVFIGLTVFYWDALWIFWGLCIGIRVSLEEYCLAMPPVPIPKNPARASARLAGRQQAW